MTYGADEPDIVLVDIAAEETVPLTQQKEVDPMNSGFSWYTPPMAKTKEHHTGGHEWMISGHDMQVLTSSLPPGQAFITETGSFMFGSAGIKTTVELTCCTRDSCYEGIERILGGESCVKVLLHNEGSEEGFVGITPNFPAKIVPLKFGTHIKEDGYWIAQGGSYMSHLGEVHVGCDLDCSPKTCCCAGFGCFRQKISGEKDSVLFVASGGTPVFKQLEEGERITVDTRSVTMIENTVKMGITPNGRICMCCFGGEGCCSTTLTGPGKIFMQSMPFKKFQAAVQQTVIEDRGDKTSVDNFS